MYLCFYIYIILTTLCSLRSALLPSKSATDSGKLKREERIFWRFSFSPAISQTMGFQDCSSVGTALRRCLAADSVWLVLVGENATRRENPFKSYGFFTVRLNKSTWSYCLLTIP